MWLIAGFLILLGVILGLKWAVNAPAKQVIKSGMWTIGLLVGLVLLFLVLTGRVNLLWAALLAILPWINRLRMARGFYNMFKSMRGPSPGQASSIETRFLAMTLDHDSGELDGVVREGVYAGQRLSNMEEAALIKLLKIVAAEDLDSLKLLESYLDRRFGSTWRADQGQQEETHSPRSKSGPMGRQEALSILGLDQNADEAAIKAAHRRLMKSAHPDMGGSDYLAAKINQAKDVLLG